MYYFSAENTCAVKVNGNFVGILNQSVQPFHIPTQSLIEILSLNAKTDSYNFILNDAFLTTPPKFAVITDLKGGYLIKILNFTVERHFKIYAQQKFGDIQITVFCDNCPKISVEGRNIFNIQTVDFFFTDAKIDCLFLNGKRFFAIAFRGEKTFLRIIREDGKTVFEKTVNAFDIKSGLVTEEYMVDIAGHTVKTIWGVSNEEIVENKRQIISRKNFSIHAVPEKILPYAFLEELLVGGDIAPFISDNLIGKEKSIKNFFGNFVGIMPPPSFRDYSEIGLIYKKGENTFNVEYSTFTLVNRKIENFVIV